MLLEKVVGQNEWKMGFWCVWGGGGGGICAVPYTQMGKDFPNSFKAPKTLSRILELRTHNLKFR